MTFLHKLAHRLARLKAAFAIGLVVALACERIAQTTDLSGSVSRLDLSPKSLTLMTNQTTKFTVVALTSTGDTTNVAVSWSVTGGTITDSTSNNGQHYGKYKAPGQTGQYKVRATGGGTSDSSTVTVAPVPVASVVVAPATASVSVGQTTQLTATPLDSTGAPLTGRAVTWASDNAGVATVSGGGLVSGVAAGSANITATIEGKSGTAVVTVSTGSGSSPWMVMDFSQYPNTAALLADVGGNSAYRWDQSRAANQGQVVLDPTVVYGALPQSMRYDFPVVGAVCQDYGIRPGGLRFPGWVNAQEMWVEVVAMFSTNFATDAGVGGCNSDYKFVFLGTNPGGRYEVKSGTYGIPGYFSTNYPSGIQDTYTFQIGSVWDGQWHVYRMHAKNSSNPGVSADAAWQVWVDGVKHVDVANVVDGSTGIWDIDLGANMNQGPAVAGMHVWWGQVKVWTVNPGW